MDLFSGSMVCSFPVWLCDWDVFDSDSARHFDPSTVSHSRRTTVTNCIDVVVCFFLTHFDPEWILTARSHLIFCALLSVLLNKNPCFNAMVQFQVWAGLCGSFCRVAKSELKAKW